MLYGILHAFPLLRSNAHILRLPFELWSLADIVIDIIIIICKMQLTASFAPHFHFPVT